MDDWGSPWADDDSADPSPPSIRNHLGSPPTAFADISDTTTTSSNSLHNNTHAVAHRLQPDPWAAADGALGDSAAWADTNTPVIEDSESANGGGGCSVDSNLWPTQALSPAVAAGHEHWADCEAPPPSHSPPSRAVAKTELSAANRDSAVRGGSTQKPEGEQSKAKDGKSTIPATSISAAGDDDDFGDFVEEADFDDFDEQRPAAAPQAMPAAGTTPAFTIDPALVRKLYPIPTSAPSLPALEEGVIHTVGARKAWYRLTEGGTLRKVNAVDEDDYVRVSWAGSKVRQDVHGIVSKWAKESRFVGRVKGSRGSRPMFGWAAGGAQEAKKRDSLSAGRVAPPLQSHIRHASETGPASSIKKQTDPSPPTPTFGWASFASTPLPKTVSSTRPPPPPAVNRANGAANTPRGPNPPAALPPPKPKPKSSPNKSPEMTRAGPKTPPPPPPQPISATADNWETFESLQNQPRPAPTQVSGDWGAFEQLVSGPGTGTSKPVVLPSKTSPGKATDELTRTQSSSSTPRSSVKRPAPAVLSISTHGDDDDWGEMQSPTKSPATPQPTATSSGAVSSALGGASQAGADNWDLSFFEKPAAASPPQPQPQQQQQGASAAGGDLWDTPQPQPQAAVGQKNVSEEDRTLQRIVDGLPNLAYMLT